jgi:hypothetical protein
MNQKDKIRHQIVNHFDKNTKPHLYLKWGLNIQSMVNSRLRVIFMGFFTYNAIKLQQNEMQ